jgi:hypothetical protein
MYSDWDQWPPPIDLEAIAIYVAQRLGAAGVEAAVRAAVGEISFTPAQLSAQIESALKLKLQPFIKELAGKLSDRVSGWYNEQTDELEIYPNGTRLVHRRGNTKVIVIEEEPKVRRINYQGQAYSVGLPYVVFTFAFNGQIISEATVHFRKEPLRKLSDPLGLPCLPNVEEGTCKICWYSASAGTEWTEMHESVGFRTGSYSEKISAALRYFWASQFSKDWSKNFIKYSNKYPADFGTFETWAGATQKDKMFFLKTEMVPAGTTVEENITRVTKEAAIKAIDIQQKLVTDMTASVGKLTHAIDLGLSESTDLVDSKKIADAVFVELKRTVQMACVMTAAEVERQWGMLQDDSFREAAVWKKKYEKEFRDHSFHVDQLLGELARKEPEFEQVYDQFVLRRLAQIKAEREGIVADPYEDGYS